MLSSLSRKRAGRNRSCRPLTSPRWTELLDNCSSATAATQRLSPCLQKQNSCKTRVTSPGLCEAQIGLVSEAEKLHWGTQRLADAGFRLTDDVPADMISVLLGRGESLVIVSSPAYRVERAHPAVPAELSKRDCVRMRLCHACPATRSTDGSSKKTARRFRGDTYGNGRGKGRHRGPWCPSRRSPYWAVLALPPMVMAETRDGPAAAATAVGGRTRSCEYPRCQAGVTVKATPLMQKNQVGWRGPSGKT
jgi:hypothetical protein